VVLLAGGFYWLRYHGKKALADSSEEG